MAMDRDTPHVRHETPAHAALQGDPGQRVRLAQALMARGQSLQAAAELDAAAAQAPLPPPLRALHAQALLASGRWADAATAFNEALAALPGQAGLRLGLAAALLESGDEAAAEAAAREALRRGLDQAGVHFVLGRALAAQGRHEDAEQALVRCLVIDPLHVPAHTNLADLAWMRRGELKAATARLDATLLRHPRVLPLHLLRARLHECAGDTQRAYELLMAVPAALQGAPDVQAAAARTARALHPQQALQHARRALASAPGHAEALGLYGDLLLINGDAVAALAVAERLLAADADDGHALALQATAWRVLGDSRYRQRYDYASLVRAAPLTTPSGWPDLDAYLADLGAALRRGHDRLRAQPLSQSLRGGTQIELRPQHSDEAAIKALAEAIDAPVRAYIEALGDGDDPLRRRRRRSYCLAGMWSVRLRPGGHHVNHYHGRGWLSSACHIEVPPEQGDPHAGWLQFGQPGLPLPTPLPAEHRLRPQPGMLVLFPSWMWHGTVPFQATDGSRRLSVAFDALPA